MTGTIKSISGQTLTISTSRGDRTVSVVSGATITLDGKAGKFSDLKVGQSVSTVGDPATTVTATCP